MIRSPSFPASSMTPITTMSMTPRPTPASRAPCVTRFNRSTVTSATPITRSTNRSIIRLPTASNTVLKRLNELMVKAKPAYHKHEMLKPFHKTAEFCGTCHKVSLPGDVTDYKEFLRGQNHYDSYLLSGVSGHGARSFYYPPKARRKLQSLPHARCRQRGLGGEISPQNLAVWRSTITPSPRPTRRSVIGWAIEAGIDAHRKILAGSLRVDLFGLRDGGSIDGELVAPLYENSATVKAGETYLIETVLRTMTLGHHFTQGTSDSNEVWVEMTATARRQGDRPQRSSR